MKLRHWIAGLLVFAVGCDTIDRDTDAQALTINNQPVYFLPGGNGYIDLPSRVVSPGKIRVEVTTTTRHGQLTDLGKGLLQYSPEAGHNNDSFGFRVFSSDSKIISEDSIDIVIPTHTELDKLPCGYIFTMNDSVNSVSGPVTVSVVENDYTCTGPITVSIASQPLYGTAIVVDNKIHYSPNASFAGSDWFIYKASVVGSSIPDAYAMLTISGKSVASCQPLAIDDIFYKSKTDTTTSEYAVTSNDLFCKGLLGIDLIRTPRFGYAFTKGKFVYYKPFPNMIYDDTLRYLMTDISGKNAQAQVIIKRN